MTFRWIMALGWMLWMTSSAMADIKISAAGDLMLGNRLSGVFKSDRRVLMTKQSFTGSDIGFVNLEGPIGGDPSMRKSCISSEFCHVFSQPADVPEVLSELGVNVVSAINNHALDLGWSGVSETQRSLLAKGVEGLVAPMGVIEKVVNGKRVSILGFSANKGLPDYRSPSALSSIAIAKRQSDIVIVSMHGGCEGERALAVRNADEHCFGENRGNVVAFARSAVDAGADLLLGHGPHVPRGHEIYRGRLILWSLGNFATAQGISIVGSASLAGVAKIVMADDGRLKSWQVDSYRQDRGLGLPIDAWGLAAKVIMGTRSFAPEIDRH